MKNNSRTVSSVSAPKQQFGGDWTGEKLERVRKYLVAYATIMNKQQFRFAYIDAFAGTGYNVSKTGDEDATVLFPDLGTGEAKQLLDGSARIALKATPRFTKYIFVEKDPNRFAELDRLKQEFPELASDIVLINADANSYLRDVCENRNWKRNRAVLFLDPFGMQMSWDTLKAIAKTKAIDLWILFPLGVAVNRLLRRDGQISPGWQRRLDDFFGTPDWRESFYKTKTEENLFGRETRTEKIADFDSIARFFVERLETIFAGVAKNPLALHNSSNTPLYLLCFAAGNELGAKTAVKIAQDSNHDSLSRHKDRTIVRPQLHSLGCERRKDAKRICSLQTAGRFLACAGGDRAQQLCLQEPLELGIQRGGWLLPRVPILLCAQRSHDQTGERNWPSTA